jgi:hypothetical protein
MDIRIIINSLIIIFILHIIIININYHTVIGEKKEIQYEKFSNSIPESQESHLENNSLAFLSNDGNDEFKKKLLKYMQQEEVIAKSVPLNEFENKNIHKVEASNTYLSKENEPNFESNVADISKFYKFNYDNLDEDQLKSTSIESLSKVVDTNCAISNHNGRESVVTPDTWDYKNELPMNGGKINGIVGFDSLESQFAIYNPNKLNLQVTTEDKFNNIPHDDLRKPIVYEN